MRAAAFALFAALTAATAGANVLKKRGSNSWAGTNNYFIQGLSADDQDSYISTLKGFGVKVVRVWVNAQSTGGCTKGSNLANGCSDLETSIGQYQNQTMDLLDATISKLAGAGMKVIISPHDGNAVGSGTSYPDIYGKTWSGQSYYTDAAAATAIDKRLSWILNYRSPSSGQLWKEWSDAIAGFDVENEPFQFANDLCKGDDQAGWLCGRAQHMRQELGSSAIKIGTGGIGGDDSKGCTMMQAALDCDAIDMISVHRYAGNEASGQNPDEWSNELKSYLGKTEKLLYVEEFGSQTTQSDQSQEYPLQTSDINSVGVPFLYWQLLPKQQCQFDCGGDCNGIFVDNGNIDLGKPIQAAAGEGAAQDWTGTVY